MAGSDFVDLRRHSKLTLPSSSSCYTHHWCKDRSGATGQRDNGRAESDETMLRGERCMKNDMLKSIQQPFLTKINHPL